jgi:hypothetical protein
MIMNAVQSFFRKYHAVPATNKGPTWSEANDEALLGHAAADMKAWWQVNDSKRPPIAKRLREIEGELRKRIDPWWGMSRELIPCDIMKLFDMHSRITQMCIPEN